MEIWMLSVDCKFPQCYTYCSVCLSVFDVFKLPQLHQKVSIIAHTLNRLRLPFSTTHAFTFCQVSIYMGNSLPTAIKKGKPGMGWAPTCLDLTRQPGNQMSNDAFLTHPNRFEPVRRPIRALRLTSTDLPLLIPNPRQCDETPA